MKFKLTILSIITFHLFAFAEITILNDKEIDDDDTKITVLCIDGFKFISQRSEHGTDAVSSNLIQVYRQKGSLIVPVECEEDLRPSSKENK